jgi:hypothetical protein
MSPFADVMRSKANSVTVILVPVLLLEGSHLLLTAHEGEVPSRLAVLDATTSVVRVRVTACLRPIPVFSILVVLGLARAHHAV